MKSDAITLTLRCEDSERFDRALAARLADVSRRQLREWIAQGGVYVDGRRTRRQSLQLDAGRTYRITIYPFDATAIEALEAGIEWKPRILYRDTELLAVDKPAGIPTGPTRQSARHHLTAFLEAAGLLPREHYPVHRLDRETTGVVLIALRRRMAGHLGDLFADNAIAKRYLAIVKGIPDREEWEVRGRLSPPQGPDRPARLVTGDTEGVLFSHTRFRLLAQASRAGMALVEARPITGRTHQIRAHLAHEGLPVLGDWRYGQSGGELALHCREIDIPGAPGHNPLKIRASLPAAMQSLVEEFFLTALDSGQI